MDEAERHQLVADLETLTARGVRGPEDILDGPPGLLDLVGGPESSWVRAQAVYRLLHAATAAMGRPRGPALRALYALDPSPPGMGTLTKTERRQLAAAWYKIEGDSFRKVHEKRLIKALAIEIARRIAVGDDTTRQDPTGRHEPLMPQGRPGPSTPPPPAASFKPNTLITPAEGARARKPL